MSSSAGSNPPQKTGRSAPRRARAILWAVLGLVTLLAGQWPLTLICVILLINELAILRWGAQARIARAELELVGVALFFLVTGIVLLARRSFFLGTLCVVGSVCRGLVLATVGSALRRRGLFRRAD